MVSSFRNCLTCRKLGINHNGPAIKGGCVAERMETGAVLCNRGRVLVPAGMNEAWRTFCRHGTNFLSYTSVAVQVFWRTGHKSRHTKFYRKHWRGRGISIPHMSW